MNLNDKVCNIIDGIILTLWTGLIWAAEQRSQTLSGSVSLQTAHRHTSTWAGLWDIRQYGSLHLTWRSMLRTPWPGAFVWWPGQWHQCHRLWPMSLGRWLDPWSVCPQFYRFSSFQTRVIVVNRKIKEQKLMFHELFVQNVNVQAHFQVVTESKVSHSAAWIMSENGLMSDFYQWSRNSLCEESRRSCSSLHVHVDGFCDRSKSGSGSALCLSCWGSLPFKKLLQTMESINRNQENFRTFSHTSSWIFVPRCASAKVI